MDICEGEILSKTGCRYSSEFIDSQLAYNSMLNVFDDYLNYRGTGIVCTIGPACAKVETIAEMIKTGMCIARFNFSHGAHADHQKMFDLVREAAAKVSGQRHVAMALDTKGPEIRTGLNKDGANITLEKEGTVTLTTDDAFKEQNTAERIYLDYKSLAKSIKVGQIILIADGNVVLKAKEIKGNDVVCDVISGMTFGSRKNACLPLVKTDLPALSEKDVQDIKFGMEQKLDIIFASFIRSADNVNEIRKLLHTTEHGKKMKIISKIENYEGVNNICEIIDASDGIMVARGDLGMDLDMEKVIVAQKKIISTCNLKGKPVICATQMLESMINSYRPTRAEISDVMNSVLDGTDCVMLSGESANGKYPVQAVKTLHLIAHAAEKINRTKKHFEMIKESMCHMTEEQATAMAAVDISYKVKADGIIVLTTTGKSAQLLSQFRPRCLIFSVTRDAEVARSLHLFRNVYPILFTGSRVDKWEDDIEQRVKFIIKHAVDSGLFKVGSKLVLLTGYKSGAGHSNSIRVGSVSADLSFAGYR